MELKVQNFDRFVQDQCKSIIDSASNLESLFKSYDFAEKSKTDRQIVRMTFAVQQIYRLAFPTPGSADNPDILVVDIEHPNWDFKPWFREKVEMIEDAFDDLLQYYEKDLNEFKLPPNNPLRSKEFILEMLEHDLKTIKAYAEAVLSMFDSGRLKVRNVKLEEEEE